MQRPTRVLLVTMPCASVERPPLGITLLQAGLRSRGIECDLAHLNLVFAEMLGLPEYRRFTGKIPYGALAGDWVFSECLFGVGALDATTYVDEILRDRYKLSPDQLELVFRARSIAPAFLEKCLAESPWAEYDLVGFTACGPQNVASLALARRIKAAHRRVVIAVGGGNWHGEMGIELHARFPAVDIAFLGEADLSFPAAVLALRAGGGQLQQLPGVAVRRASRPVRPPDAVEDLDDLPPPDYSDYLAALSMYGFDGSLRPALQMETARGCSWAEKSPCAFCGLSGPTRRYRTKSPTRVLSELRRLAALDCSLVELVDNVVSPAFLSTVLPELAADPLPVPLFFEARPQVTRDQVRAMAAASASFQPGIESLSDHILRLMHKGGRGLEGIRLLKWCRASGVRVCWNLIYGIPGERESDYEEMLGMLPAITFLEPPLTQGRLNLDRFSPYFDAAHAYGFRDVAPLAAYAHVYALPRASLKRIAHTFDYDYPDGAQGSTAATSLHGAVEAWQRLREPGELKLSRGPDGPRLVDTRPVASRHVRRLDPLDEALYGAAADIASRPELLAAAGSLVGDEHGLMEAVQERLDRFVAAHVMVRAGDRYLSLAL